MNFLNPDSKFMTVTNTMLDYVKLGLLFMLFSIPVITTGAAFSAAMYVGMKIARDEAPVIWKPFWKGFKANFKQGTLLTVIFLILGGLLSFDWYYVMQMETTALLRVVRAVIFILTLFLVMIALYCAPLIARYELKMRQVFRNAVIYAILNFPKNLVAVLILVAGVVMYTYVSALVPIIVCAFPALEIYYLSRLCAKSFERTAKRQAEQLNSAA